MSPYAHSRNLGTTLWTFTLMLATACGGGGDDGDGGQLSAREERQVKEWFTEVTELGQAFDQMGNPSADLESQREEAVSQLRRLARLSPPRLADNEADRAFQDLHEGMKILIDAMLDLFEKMPSPDEGPAAMGAIMQAMAGMEQTMQEAEAKVRGAEETIRTIIEVDFADDPEVQAMLQGALGNINP